LYSVQSATVGGFHRAAAMLVPFLTLQLHNFAFLSHVFRVPRSERRFAGPTVAHVLVALFMMAKRAAR
jgi:hypothetical protein